MRDTLATMPGPDHLSLEQRVARLERLVGRLLEHADQAEVDEAPPPEGADAAGLGPPPQTPLLPLDQPQPAPGPAAGLAGHGERWLGRVGVVFVVLAFGFFFRYAFDQGWIGPSLRLVLGLVAATVMLALGLRLEGVRERYSQYLLGGAVGLYYLVGFASYELYDLVPFALAFGFMVVVTGLAFLMAMGRSLPSLSVLGAGGGLATPFLVNTGTGNVPALVAYTVLLLTGAGAVQFMRGWRMLLLSLGLGGLGVMGLAIGMTSGPQPLEGTATVIGIVAVWALWGILPLFRAGLHRVDEQSWPVPPLGGWSARFVSPEQVAPWLLRAGCIFGGFAALMELGGLFSVERATFGMLFGAGALTYLMLARLLVGTRPALAASAEAATIFAVLAISLLLFDYRVMLPLAVVGAAAHMADRGWGLRGVALLGHVLFAQLLILIISRLDVVGLAGNPPFGLSELGALGAIALALTTSFTLRSTMARRAYRIAAHGALMVWLATQFASMERGQELTSLSWGVYGIALLLLSLRLRERGVQLAGLVTLGIVAAKLLLVDMAQVDVIWRILLFMGFGAAFLGLSYLINRQAEDSEEAGR